MIAEKEAPKRGTQQPPYLLQNVLIWLFEAALSNSGKKLQFSAEDYCVAMCNCGISSLLGATISIDEFVGLFRDGKSWPLEIKRMAPSGKMWIIVGKGDATYGFRLITTPTLAADTNRCVTKLHDATPEIVRRFKLSDEQAVLARVRYNRLVDVFCRCVAHSLQNHLRTKVEGIGQIEIDELYVAANRQGEHFIIPVQAKKKQDRLGVSQLLQDLEYCRVKYPDMRPRPLGAQLMSHKEDGRTYDKIVIFEFECRDEPDDVVIRKVSERHFVLLPHSQITASDFSEAERRSEDSVDP